MRRFELLRGRQSYYETGALSVFFKGQRTLVLSYDGLTDGESHSCALAFGREEGIENAVAYCARYSRSAVFERKPDLSLPVVATGIHPQYPALRGHRVEGIDFQVHEDLLKLVRVAVNHQRRRPQICHHGDTAPHCFGLN